MTIVRALCRFFLAAILLATALGKALDVIGFRAVIDSYQVLPRFLLLPSAAAMIVIEFFLAGWLLSGRRLKKCALVVAALHVVFIGWISIALLRGLEIENCGCFGVFYARPLTAWTIVEDLVMVLVALVLFGLSVRLDGLDRRS